MNSSCWCNHLFIILSTIFVVACSASSAAKENDNGEPDRVALLALRDGLIAGGGTPPDDSSLSSWNTSLHFCQWQGISCGKRHKRVTVIDLEEQKLDGVFPPSIGNLTFLRKLNLPNNSLHGEVPKEIGKLRRLEYLDLTGNFFQGQIPIELSNCSNLAIVGLNHNSFTGRIPFPHGSLPNIIYFYAARNSLVGEMPSFFRNLSYALELHIGENQFHGEIGDSLQGLSSLTAISLRSNNFSGSITPLYNLSSLQKLDISSNNFSGSFPQDMDIAFPNLAWLSLVRNNFAGTIPHSLSNISRLTMLQIGWNKFAGNVPDNLGKLKNLMVLHMSGNDLGSTDTLNDLKFIDSLTNCTKLKWLLSNNNRFVGPLPDSIANFSSEFQLLEMRGNFIEGRIPEGIGELTGLTGTDLSDNFLSGTIPASIGKLANVSRLVLQGNKLHGQIPFSVGNLTKIFHLDLSRNSMEGEIPSSIGNLPELFRLDLSQNTLDGVIPASLKNCKKMQAIYISSNQFHGNIPHDVFSEFHDLTSCDLSHNSFNGTFPPLFGKMINLNMLNASHNHFSGAIPSQLGGSLGLEYLIMAGNSFEESIPISLASLKGLKWLDLSNNSLSGAIPNELADIAGLQYLNLSFNKLQGQIPLFKKSTTFSISGNNKLCGGKQELQLQPCLHSRRNKTISRGVVIAIALCVIICVSLFILSLIFFRCRGKYKKDNIDDLAEGYRRVTYAELFKATEGFAETNLIGTGSFGNVYRGIIFDGDEGKPVAVKVLNLSNYGAAKSFKAECKILGRSRHRNLLKIVTSCSSIDHKGNDFKALVLDFMSNGNLDNWLHFSDWQLREVRPLTLAKRLEIAIDVGCALDYLHHGCETPIVHCDLKPSNILLDEDMVAHVADFGIAKLLHGVTGNLNGGESLSAAIKGTIGYVAPEHGMGAAISAQGDIYSYGIILLELITGKRPTDEMFSSEISLRSFIERAIPDHIEEVVDQCIMNELDEAAATHRNPEQLNLQWHNFLVSFAEVGTSCSAEPPRDRMDIQSAIRCLKGVKEKYESILQ